MKLQHFLKTVDSPFGLSDIAIYLNHSPHCCFFIKDECSRYLFANQNFINLMGLKTIQQLQQFRDEELSIHQNDAKRYQDHDAYVVEEGFVLTVNETLSPRHNQPILKTMEGKLFPLFAHNSKARYIMGMVAPQNQLLRLDWDTVFQLSPLELDELLVKRSYLVELDIGQISFSKMEIKTLIQLLNGRHAGEIAELLHIKQTTVESYIVNIKNKLGLSLKSELIQYVTRNRLLQQIII